MTIELFSGPPPMEYKAAVLHAVGESLVVESVVRHAIGPDDVLIKIRAAGVCHTDLEVIDGSLRYPLPIILGHEAAGIVIDAGENVDPLRLGEHVVLSWNPHCGGCFYCGADLPILCEQYVAKGVPAFDFHGRNQYKAKNDRELHHLMYLGSFAEYCTVPSMQAIAVPKEVPFDRACLIGCGVMTGVGGAINIASISPGSSVFVIGCGAVGLSAIQGARLSKAGTIIAADLSDSKLDLARKLGATHSVNPRTLDVVEFVRNLTHGRGVDVVLESAGHPDAYRITAEVARPGGEIIWLGKIDVNTDVHFRWGSLMQEKRIRRSSYGGARPERDFPRLARFYLDGSLLLDELITRRITLDEINSGFDDLRQGGSIRSVVVFND